MRIEGSKCVNSVEPCDLSETLRSEMREKDREEKRREIQKSVLVNSNTNSYRLPKLSVSAGRVGIRYDAYGLR